VMFRTILGQRRLAEAKNDFISNMTHEFKTPISTISLACEALGDNDMIKEAQRDTIAPFVKMIGQENKRLESLVERILQSASLEKGKLKIKYEELELNEIVSLVAQKARMRVPSNKGRINLQLAPGFLYFKGDPVHTMNLVSNLVDNAIKYSKDHVDISLTTFKKYNQIHLVVSDKGIGIKKEYLDKIFDKLYRVPTGNVHDVKGFGLGLSYVKSIAEACGWEIQVQSKWNFGSDFTLIIRDKQDKKQKNE
ncbi:MAG: HAMP domain-containing histidine kinase, partial [Crocinitomicaceae bacterium]|nr:HAMP domain-containing histidine kinase [Crocinitomicaceae bacterium]